MRRVANLSVSPVAPLQRRIQNTPIPYTERFIRVSEPDYAMDGHVADHT